jgi:hypothetical protein
MEREGPVSLDQIRAFMAASQEIRFGGSNRKEICNWVRQTLTEQQYHVQGKVGKGLLRCYLEKMTGLSRAQATRLIGQYLATGKVEERAYLRRRFPSLYTGRDIELLAEVDEAHETLSGPASRIRPLSCEIDLGKISTTKVCTRKIYGAVGRNAKRVIRSPDKPSVTSSDGDCRYDAPRSIGAISQRLPSALTPMRGRLTATAANPRAKPSR